MPRAVFWTCRFFLHNMLQVEYINVLIKCLQSVTDRDKRFPQSPVVNRDAGRQELLGAPVMFLPQLQSVRWELCCSCGCVSPGSHDRQLARECVWDSSCGQFPHVFFLCFIYIVRYLLGSEWESSAVCPTMKNISFNSRRLQAFFKWVDLLKQEKPAWSQQNYMKSGAVTSLRVI